MCSSLIWVYSVCICHFARKLGVRNFSTLTNNEKENESGLISGVVLISNGLIIAELVDPVISKSNGLSEILRDIRTSTYKICRIQEKK